MTLVQNQINETHHNKNALHLMCSALEQPTFKVALAQMHITVQQLVKAFL